jgi:hypothetical protein
VDQGVGPKYFSTAKRFSEDEHSLSCELRYAYPEEAGIESYIRTSSLKDGVVTIREDITLSEEKEIDFHLMLASEPKIVESGRILLPEGRTLTFDTLLTAEVEEFDPVGMDAQGHWGTKVLYRLHFRVDAAKCNVEFTIR